MARKQLDKLVTNETHAIDEFKLQREHLVLEFLKKDSNIDLAPESFTIADGDSLPILLSSQPINTPRTIKWGKAQITNGKLVSIGGALVKTDLSIANRTSTTFDILSSSGTGVTLPFATTTLAGLMLAADYTKLTHIEDYADVTDKENVGAAIWSSPTKTQLETGDYVAILDKDGNLLSKIIWQSITDTSVTVSQVSHGFVVGDCIKPSSTGWVLTQADAIQNAGTIGVVYEVVNANTFKYITEGFLPGDYVEGEDYFLSVTTAGEMFIRTGNETWIPGQIIEYVGTGVAGGIQIHVEIGQEIQGSIFVDKYVNTLSFSTITRKLTATRTGGLSTLETIIPEYVEVDTLNSVLTRGNTTTLGATFDGTVLAGILSVYAGYTITKAGSALVISSPSQTDFNVNSTVGMRLTTGGLLQTYGTITTPNIKISTGATAEYVWKCTNVDGSGAWSPIAASNIYKGTWNPVTNTPTLVDGTGTTGWYYRVTVAGTWNGITYAVGDDTIYNGTIWQRIPGQGFILSPATASVLGGVKIGAGVSVTGDGTISVSTNYQAPLIGTGWVYSTGGVITYDPTVYASQIWVNDNYAQLIHTHSYAPLTRNIYTQHSLTGGGNLSADRTLNLVNDVTSPGNYYVYGTTMSGVKGWISRHWLPITRGIYFPSLAGGVNSYGYVGVGNVDPEHPLHVLHNSPGIFAAMINNSDSVTGHGLRIAGGDVALEILQSPNYINPVLKVFGNGGIKWFLPPTAVKTKMLFYDDATSVLSVGAVPTLVSLGGISLTSLSATAPLMYTNTTGNFYIPVNTYESYFGNPAQNGYILSSTTAGVRSWVAPYLHPSYTIRNVDATVGQVIDIFTSDTQGHVTNITLRTLVELDIPNLNISKIIGLQTALDNKQPIDNDLTAIAGLAGTSGLLKKTATDTWSLDTTAYIAGIDFSMVVNALGYTPERPLGNPPIDGYILSSTTTGVRSWVPRYLHPTYTARSIDAVNGQVIDTFTSDTQGHVTGITLRSLAEADIPSLSISKTTGLQTALDGKQPVDNDLTAIAALTGNVGLLRKTGVDTWSIDTVTYEPWLGNPLVNGQILSSSTIGVRTWVNPYAHPLYTARSLDATTGQVIDVFTSDAQGHVTNITYRSLVESDIPSLSISKTTGLQTALDSKQLLDNDLTAIAALTGTFGLLRKTATDTWAIDTTAYEISLGNPSVTGYILSSTTAGVRSWVARYSHPIYSAFSLDAVAGQVIDVFTSDSQGHVTNITYRTLVESDIPTLSISKTNGLQTALDGKQPVDNDLTSIAAITGTGLLRRTGVDTWSLDGTSYGTVGSISAGAGMNFTTITASGSIIMGTPSTISTASSNSASGSTHTHTLDMSGRNIGTMYSITGGGNLGTDKIFSLVGDVASPGNNMRYGTNASGVRGWYSDIDTDTDTNYYVYATSFNTSNGYLTLSRNVLGDISVAMDGRYSLIGHGHSYLSDAPSDNSYYARRNGVWATFTPGGGADGNNYTTALSYASGTGVLTLSRSGLIDLSTTISWSTLFGKPSTFTPSAHTIDSHSNVSIVNPANYSVLTYENGTWYNVTTNNFLAGGSFKTIHGNSILGTGNITINHNTLNNLDYSNAGHTNFAYVNGDTGQSFYVNHLYYPGGSNQWRASGYENGEYCLYRNYGNTTYQQLSITPTAIGGGSLKAYEYQFIGSSFWNMKGSGDGGTMELMYNNGGSWSTPMYVQTNGYVYAQEFFRGSSRELKTNIEPVKISALDMVNKTTIFTYNMKSTGNFAVGFIAEDTHEWLSGDDKKAHMYGNHLAVLTKAIQEEDDKITSLENRVRELEEQLNMR